jgi:hypothetical protein
MMRDLIKKNMLLCPIWTTEYKHVHSKQQVNVLDCHPGTHITIIVDNQERHRKKRSEEKKKRKKEKTKQPIRFQSSFVLTKQCLVLILPVYEVEVEFQEDHEHLLMDDDKNFVQLLLLYQKPFVQDSIQENYMDEFHPN